jgi:hypothetical protein
MYTDLHWKTYVEKEIRCLNCISVNSIHTNNRYMDVCQRVLYKTFCTVYIYIHNANTCISLPYVFPWLNFPIWISKFFPDSGSAVFYHLGR